MVPPVDVEGAATRHAVPAQAERRLAWVPRPWLAPVGVVAVAAAALTCLAMRDPNDAGAYPLCPFRAITGWDCPGCGALRAMHAGALGDLRGAADQNLLMLLAVPFLVWRFVTWTAQRVRGRPAREPGSPVLLVVLAISVLVFWLVRNLPGVPFLGSGIG